jgi:hypothetical protein
LLYLFTLSIECIAYAKVCGRIQTLIQPSHIGLVLKRLQVAIFLNA